MGCQNMLNAQDPNILGKMKLHKCQKAWGGEGGKETGILQQCES